MRCLLSLCAESVVVDQATNRASIFGLVDELSVQQFPTAVLRITPLFLIEREQDEPEQLEVVLVLALAGNEVFRAPLGGNFAGRQRLRLILSIQGLVLPTPGVFRASIWHADHELGGWEFPVIQTPAPAAAPAEPAVQA
jgi:hypothetical protein